MSGAVLAHPSFSVSVCVGNCLASATLGKLAVRLKLHVSDIRKSQVSCLPIVAWRVQLIGVFEQNGKFNPPESQNELGVATF